MNDDTIELHREVSGEGEALILLHGLYGSGANWRRYARRWSRDYRVIVPDLRNHGRSPHAEPMDYQAMAADVARLIEAEPGGRAVVLGHSMGGKVAMALALTRPALVRGLIVADIAPVTYADNDHDTIIAAMLAIDLAKVGNRSDADGQLAERIDSQAIRQFLLTNLERADDGWDWRLPLATLRRALPDILGWPALNGHWDGPALFIHGARSPYVDDAGRRAIAGYFPYHEMETIPEAGHWLHVEAPEAFKGAVEAFLDGRL
ncbi:alpha/beta fold hydrolase [Arhodomonas aquaeolei]|uniref:alpha/beta fold hydrolase n=1 Tax=Arhodomonas aquaeolei TaxID=2369 RepID=UPI002168BA81|nr:alpha/beta fold hydrolase [Arhodomonas aquaeolei]MCS4505113.1 alpha/beta fold hydrolase [Arhodomonas aquaeolei]